MDSGWYRCRRVDRIPCFCRPSFPSISRSPDPFLNALNYTWVVQVFAAARELVVIYGFRGKFHEFICRRLPEIS
jgi:hypothetical protein